ERLAFRGFLADVTLDLARALGFRSAVRHAGPGRPAPRAGRACRASGRVLAFFGKSVRKIEKKFFDFLRALARPQSDGSWTLGVEDKKSSVMKFFLDRR